MSTFQIIRILREKKINLVFTTGGYISAPTIVASKILRIPVIIHESNLIPGMVTKYFGFLCNYVLLGFKKTNSYLKNCKTIFTGTPLRHQFYKSHHVPEWVPKGKEPLLIVMGGSQGAKAINQILYDSLEFLMKKKFRIVHIIGECNKYSFNLKNCKTIFTGTPLREQFYTSNLLPEWAPKGKGPLLIVMGGSQGAKAINQILYESL